MGYVARSAYDVRAGRKIRKFRRKESIHTHPVTCIHSARGHVGICRVQLGERRLGVRIYRRDVLVFGQYLGRAYILFAVYVRYPCRVGHILSAGIAVFQIKARGQPALWRGRMYRLHRLPAVIGLIDNVACVLRVQPVHLLYLLR